MLRRGALGALLVLLASLPACTCSQTPTSGGAPSASAASAPAPVASPSSSVETSTHDTDVKPVYPPLTGPPHPLAVKVCDAMHGVLARRRAACCSQPAAEGVVSECLRNVSGALSSGAVAVDEAQVGRCAQAMETSLQGCDWVAPAPFTPDVPAACLGLFKGTLKQGAVCRSAHECEGTMACRGVGPTSTGRCGPSLDEGPCGVSVDPLAIYARQGDPERSHPLCKGFCDRRRCAAPRKEGAECTFNDQCGPGQHCGDGRCKKGEAGKEGERCLGTRCEAGLRCDQGTCRAPKKEGEACERNEQCRGFCVQKDGKGTCSARCEATLPYGAGSAVTLPRLKPKK